MRPYNLLVGSGKGGVGKSTVCLNLAIALAAQGLKVGVMDADIYGPSIPIMLGLRRISPRTILSGDREIVVPFTKFGIKAISIGFFVDEAQSVVWRGPMLHTALQKMIQSVDWGELDLMLVDLPPGTGDVPLSLSQLMKVDGALMVTTPQEAAAVDVVKAINGLHQLHIPLVGIVENMAGDVFGTGGGARLAERFETQLLGTIPLHPHICRSGDEGTPAACHTQGAGSFFHQLKEPLAKLVESGFAMAQR